MLKVPENAVRLWMEGDALRVELDGHFLTVPVYHVSRCGECGHEGKLPKHLRGLIALLKQREISDLRTIGTRPSPTQSGIDTGALLKELEKDEAFRRRVEREGLRAQRERDKAAEKARIERDVRVYSMMSQQEFETLIGELDL